MTGGSVIFFIVFTRQATLFVLIPYLILDQDLILCSRPHLDQKQLKQKEIEMIYWLSIYSFNIKMKPCRRPWLINIGLLIVKEPVKIAFDELQLCIFLLIFLLPFLLYLFIHLFLLPFIAYTASSSKSPDLFTFFLHSFSLSLLITKMDPKTFLILQYQTLLWGKIINFPTRLL